MANATASFTCDTLYRTMPGWTATQNAPGLPGPRPVVTTILGAPAAGGRSAADVPAGGPDQHAARRQGRELALEDEGGVAALLGAWEEREVTLQEGLQALSQFQKLVFGEDGLLEQRDGRPHR
jgi:hypothetical protein